MTRNDKMIEELALQKWCDFSRGEQDDLLDNYDGSKRETAKDLLRQVQESHYDATQEELYEDNRKQLLDKIEEGMKMKI